jgi:hypothetical protein
MALAAQLYQKGREAERHRVEFDATLRDPAFVPLDVVVEDLSTGGFRIVTSTTLPLAAEIGLGLAGIGTHRARIVWRSEGVYGCEFLTPLKDDELRTALSAPSSEPLVLPTSTPRDFASETENEQLRDEQSGLSLRGRLYSIIAAAIVAWLATIGLAWVAFRIVGSLLR